MKNTIIYIYRIMCLPSFIAHELSHLIMLLILFRKYYGIGFNVDNYKTFEYSGYVKIRPSMNCFNIESVNHKKIKIYNFLFFMSPFMVWVIFIVLSFYYFFPIYIICYLLFTVRISIPSKYDFNGVKFFGIDRENKSDDYYDIIIQDYINSQKYSKTRNIINNIYAFFIG